MYIHIKLTEVYLKNSIQITQNKMSCCVKYLQKWRQHYTQHINFVPKYINRRVLERAKRFKTSQTLCYLQEYTKMCWISTCCCQQMQIMQFVSLVKEASTNWWWSHKIISLIWIKMNKAKVLKIFIQADTSTSEVWQMQNCKPQFFCRKSPRIALQEIWY